MFALHVDTGFLEEYHDSFRSAWREERMSASFGKLSDTGDPKSINVLLICNGGCYGMLRDVLREGELDEDAMDGWGVIVREDPLKKFGLGDVFGELDEFAVDIGLGRGYVGKQESLQWQSVVA